jgi:glutathionyl-hydroquinone reductase
MKKNRSDKLEQLYMAAQSARIGPLDAPTFWDAKMVFLATQVLTVILIALSAYFHWLAYQHRGVYLQKVQQLWAEVQQLEEVLSKQATPQAQKTAPQRSHE